MNDSFDTFSKNIPATSENYYSLTPSMDDDSKSINDNTPFKMDDSYIEDSYFPPLQNNHTESKIDYGIDYKNNTSGLFSNKSNDSFTIPDGSFMDDTFNNYLQTNNANYILNDAYADNKHTNYYNGLRDNNTIQSTDQTSSVNHALINKSLKNINININIYNNNVRLYKKGIIILENYINFLFKNSDECFENIKSIMKNIKADDNRRNINRDYTSLFSYIISVYNIYEKFIYTKIKELENYFISNEKNLLKHSHVLIQCIWSYYNSIPLPKNNGIEYYENYLMKKNFDDVNKKFQLYFKSLYSKLNLLIMHE